MTRDVIVSEARAWIGTPFSHQARLKGVGVDCAGLIIGVARELGMVGEGFDITGYSRDPDGRTLLAYCETHMQRIGREDIEPGDVVVIRWHDHPQHLGIVGDYVHGGHSLIHAFADATGRGKVIEQRLCLDDLPSGGRFVAAYRLPEVA